MKKVEIFDFKSHKETIPQVLESINLREEIKGEEKILIKPNLTTNLSPPVTTPKELVEEMVKFCQKNSQGKIIIAEDSGGCETKKAFKDLGFNELAKKYDVELLDLNQAERIEKQIPEAKKIKRVFLPKIAFESFIINLPVLKVHGAAKMTAAMKNVFGFYLNSSYLGKISQLSRIFNAGWWNKSELHFYGVFESIIDLNRYINFDFNLVDASIGQIGSEVHGQKCDPPIAKMVAGEDAREVDRVCAPLLSLDPNEIKYLASNP